MGAETFVCSAFVRELYSTALAPREGFACAASFVGLPQPHAPHTELAERVRRWKKPTEELGSAVLAQLGAAEIGGPLSSVGATQGAAILASFAENVGTRCK